MDTGQQEYCWGGEYQQFLIVCQRNLNFTWIFHFFELKWRFIYYRNFLKKVNWPKYLRSGVNENSSLSTQIAWQHAFHVHGCHKLTTIQNNKTEGNRTTNVS